MAQDKCHFCEKPATKLCDHPVLSADGFYHPATPHLCDLPICDDHAAVQGKTFDMHGPGTVDTMDHCPFHSGVDRKDLVRAIP